MSPAHRVDAADTAVYLPSAAFTLAATNDREVTMGSADDALLFRPTDVVEIGATSGAFTISRVIGDRILFDRPVDLAPGGGTMVLADIAPDARVVRITYTEPSGPTANALLPDGAIAPGTLLTFDQTASGGWYRDTVR